MYATFDLRPQPGEMVVSRSDVKRRRKEGNILEESLQGSPKRTKVHAQRKFAQGSSNMSSPALTPVKDKDKVKTNGTVLSPELIPTKRPKTEDFLTFLCFRGTPILPPCLDFFNIATVQETPDEEQGSSLGDCSRESTRTSRIASASIGSNRLQRSAERNSTETATIERYKTGGGIFTPKLTGTITKIVDLLKPQFEPLKTAYDSSADYFGHDQVIYEIEMEEETSAGLSQDTEVNVLGDTELDTSGLELSQPPPHSARTCDNI